MALITDSLYTALIAAVNTGWVPVADTWSYASATTITVPTGAASVYQVGQKLKLTQTTVKYFYIVGVADTVLTITGGSDYTLTNAAISSIYFSNVESPLGFPDWFNWTPTPTGFSSAPTGIVARFSVHGRRARAAVTMPNAGTSNATTFTVSAPIAAATIANMTWGGIAHYLTDAGAVLTSTGRVLISSAGTAFSLYINGSNGAWTNSGGKLAHFYIEWEI